LIFSVIVLSTASAAEPLLVIDPPRGLSLVLSNGESGISRGTLTLKTPFNPHEHPYIRVRYAKNPQQASVAALPAREAETVALKELPLPGRHEWGGRLPPGGILADGAYPNTGLHLTWGDKNAASAELDYVMADAEPTLGLAEFDSATEPGLVLQGMKGSIEDGVATLLPQSADSRLTWGGLQLNARTWNTFEVRLKLPAASKSAAKLIFTTADGLVVEQPFDVIADGNFHTYRLVMMKHPAWQGVVTGLAFQCGHVPCVIDWLRLISLPEPGAGVISRSIPVLGVDLDGWREMRRRVTNWRFVAGQSSFPGNAAKMARDLGEVFKDGRIRWETDMPTRLFLDQESYKLPVVDGSYSTSASARAGFEAINSAAIALEKHGVRLDAVHFDGLMKRLLMPEGWPYAGRSAGGGFLEQTRGDFAKAYDLVAQTTCEFLVLARTDPDSRLRSTEFWVQPNFHYWGWEFAAQKHRWLFTNLPDPGNFREMMDALARRDREFEKAGRYHGPTPLAGFGADWVFMNVQRRRLVSYEWYATQVLGYRFNIANNGSLHGDTPWLRSMQSLGYLEQFRAEGGRAQMVVPYYWMPPWSKASGYGENGHGILPETQPHSFAWTALHSARMALHEIPPVSAADHPEPPPATQGDPE
jgi:hypothetical protein